MLKTTGPILPPFNFNNAEIAAHSPEVTGRILLNSLCERLGWNSLRGRRLLDFGCGVRFARTIYNLEIDIAQYCGIDANAAAIAWLRENVRDPRFRFEYLDMRNAMYNPGGSDAGVADAMQALGLRDFDAACMFSVITHQPPQQSDVIFAMLRPCAPRLYFTAFIDDGVEDYADRDPSQPLLLATYSSGHIRRLLAKADWHVDNIFAPSLFQLTAFVCSAEPRRGIADMIASRWRGPR